LSNSHYFSDCLDVSSDIPDVFKKAIFWPRKNNLTTKKRAAKVKIPSVATSLAWQEYHQAKEMEKYQCQIAIEERKRKRQETAQKKKQEREEKKQKVRERERYNEPKKQKLKQNTIYNRLRKTTVPQC